MSDDDSDGDERTLRERIGDAVEGLGERIGGSDEAEFFEDVEENEETDERGIFRRFAGRLPLRRHPDSVDEDER